MNSPLFKDRTDAGKRLAKKLEKYKDRNNVLVLALPRGGVPVGVEVARALDADFDIFIVRKLGVPGQEELAMGSIAMGDIRIENEDIIRAVGISREVIDRVAKKERAELIRREKLYRGKRPAPQVKDRTVILVDDGLATGASMRAAIQAVKQVRPQHLIVAVPVADSTVCKDMQDEADEVICAETPHPMTAIGSWYQDFRQISDEEVERILESVVR